MSFVNGERGRSIGDVGLGIKAVSSPLLPIVVLAFVSLRLLTWMCVSLERLSLAKIQPGRTPFGKHLNFLSLSLLQGRCKAAMERFYFNVRSGKCETFVYGGCGGNEVRT